LDLWNEKNKYKYNTQHYVELTITVSAAVGSSLQLDQLLLLSPSSVFTFCWRRIERILSDA
jgi:hypothetical protein